MRRPSLGLGMGLGLGLDLNLVLGLGLDRVWECNRDTAWTGA